MALASGRVQLALAGPPSADDVQLIAGVAARIFQQAYPEAEPIEEFPDAFALAEPGPDWAWPPLVGIADTQEENAYATVMDWKLGERPATIDDLNNKQINVRWVDVPECEPRLADDDDGDPKPATKPIQQPVIIIFQGYLDKIFLGSPEAAAGTLGHELSHILLGHSSNSLPGGDVVFRALSREQEANADILGAQLALRADFGYDGIVAGALRKRDSDIKAAEENRAPAPCPFIATTHPNWNDRLAVYDADRRSLWKSVGAFSDGAHFLIYEQYDLAAQCFERVTREFPDCYEAWANLGYARLMMYCDALPAEQLRDYDVGQLVLGGFYRRAESFGIRGTLEELWLDATAALQHAIDLKADLIVAKATLAAAYLVHPAGKDVGRAAELFDQVVAAVERGDVEEGVDRLTFAALLVNAGVSEMANGRPEAAEKLFARARSYFESGADSASESNVAGAIQYNRAVMLAESDDADQQSSAIKELEQYLASNSSASTWWALAFESYERLCKDRGVRSKPRDALIDAANVRLRMTTRVTLADGRTLVLNESIANLKETLGDGWATPIARGRNAQRLRYGNLGLDLICTDRLLAIRLAGKSAPTLRLEPSGPTGGEAQEIRLGMTLEDVENALGRDGKSWVKRSGATSMVTYHYFPRLGFGVRIGGDGKVSEIIVAQIP
jgi:hypothetical protein